MGLSEDFRKGVDVEMEDPSKVPKYSLFNGKRIIVGSSELNYKRDNMEIQPLLSETGISKCQHIQSL